jgi:hypothetical protein
MNLRTSALNKRWLLITVLVIIITLAGCADVSTPVETTTPAPTLTETPSPSPNETVTPTPTATSTPSPTTSPTTPTPTSTAPSPAVFILMPLYNVEVLPGDVTVTIRVDNFKIVDKIGQANAEGEGHVIYYMDVTPPTEPGQPATTTPGTFAETATTFYTWPDKGEGTHTFSVQLVNNDGTPLSPPVIATVPVPVVTPTPTPTSTPTPTESPTP